MGGDVLDPASLVPAFEGIGTAYYLIHSMGDAADFAERDRRAAWNFGAAAARAGVRRIVYLGGLGGLGDGELSPHLASRQEVGRVLADSGVPTVELRASIVIGSGSLSFEMIRALVDRLPVMVTPRWVRTLAQPIAIEDVVDCLVAAGSVPLEESRVLEVGGPEPVAYAELMREYARQRGLRRFMIPVPVLTPELSSRWLDLVTPLYAAVGRKLIDSVRNETIVREPGADAVLGVRPRGHREAIARALVNEDREFASTRWSDALSSYADPPEYGGVRFGTRLVDSRAVRVAAPPELAFQPVAAIGGRNGWYSGGWLWRLRGALDRLLGGPGMRRGRRHPEDLRVGEALDFWRVEGFEPPRLLRLRAEMKLPGRAWLQFEVEPCEGGGSEIRQTALFDPLGLAGLLYWYGVWPVHGLVFRRMLRGVARRAEELSAEPAAHSA